MTHHDARGWSPRVAYATLAVVRSLLPTLALLCACNGSLGDTSGFGTPTPTTVPQTTGEGSS